MFVKAHKGRRANYSHIRAVAHPGHPVLHPHPRRLYRAPTPTQHKESRPPGSRLPGTHRQAGHGSRSHTPTPPKAHSPRLRYGAARLGLKLHKPGSVRRRVALPRGPRGSPDWSGLLCASRESGHGSSKGAALRQGDRPGPGRVL